MFLTYDITRDETFVSCVQWLKEIRQNAPPENIVYLVGNKAELEEEREVTFDRALEFAKANNINKVFETSAKTGNNVNKIFATAMK